MPKILRKWVDVLATDVASQMQQLTHVVYTLMTCAGIPHQTQQSSQQTLFSIYNTANANLFWTVYFSSNGSLYLYWKDTSEVTTLGTQQKFRDTNAWYHFVYEMDTTLSTAADRIKLYINGVRVTEFEDSKRDLIQSFIDDNKDKFNSENLHLINKLKK